MQFDCIVQCSVSPTAQISAVCLYIKVRSGRYKVSHYAKVACVDSPVESSHAPSETKATLDRVEVGGGHLKV